jgi:group I intron endonuclease
MEIDKQRMKMSSGEKHNDVECASAVAGKHQRKVFGGIYCLRNKINNKTYIGQHAGTRLEKRWKQHNHKKNGCRALKNAINKYGWENFDKFVVEMCYGDREELDAMEKKYIIQYNSLAPNGYNLEQGGIHGRKCTLVRQRMSVCMKGRLTGPANPFFGKKTLNRYQIYYEFVEDWQASME